MFLFLLRLSLFAQEANSIFIYGKLKETENVSIPFASIAISESSRGTAANENGDFVIKLESDSYSKRLNISCIGYHSKSFAIDSLIKLSKSDFVFFLEPEILSLNEVVIAEKKSDASEIIKNAIENVSNNYYQPPFNLELHSSILTNNPGANNEFQVESILIGFYDGYFPNSKKKFDILEVRKIGTDPLMEIRYGYWPSFEIYQADVIMNQFKSGVFNLENLKHFEFEFTEVTIYEKDTVFNIEYFAPKPSKKITGYGTIPKFYKGNIFININDFAVVKHSISTEVFSYHIIYKKFNQYYFPYYISGLRVNTFKINGVEKEFRILNNIVVNKIIIEKTASIKDNSNEHDINKVKFNKIFWDKNFPLKSK